MKEPTEQMAIPIANYKTFMVAASGFSSAPWWSHRYEADGGRQEVQPL